MGCWNVKRVKPNQESFVCLGRRRLRQQRRDHDQWSVKPADGVYFGFNCVATSGQVEGEVMRKGREARGWLGE